MFKNCSTLEELKKAYRAEAKKAHPDCGGSAEQMAEVNKAYEEASERITKSSGKPRNEQEAERQASEAFKAALLKIIHLDGVEIEICGSWIWATGNTFIYRELLKEAGFWYSKNKKAWYWKEGESRKMRGHYTMAEIRTKYGSDKVDNKTTQKLSA